MSSKQPQTKKIGSAFELLPKSWEIVKQNWMAFAFVNIFAIFIAFISSFQYEDVSNTSGMALPGLNNISIIGLTSGLLMALIGLFVALFFYTMTLYLQVKASRGEKPTIEELIRSGWKYIWSVLLLLILMVLIIGLGLLLLIIPGIIAYGRLVMAPYYLVDKNMDVMKAIKASNAKAKSFPGKVWGAIGVVILVSIAVNIISAVPIIGALVGTLFGIAFSMVIVLRYQQLKDVKSVTVKE